MSLHGIYPAFKENNILIVFESSNYFIPYLCVAIKTLIENTKPDNNYDIVILGDRIDSINEKRIQELSANINNVSIRFYDPYFKVKKYVEAAKFSYLTINYYRMALPWIMENYNSAINIGADILIKKDIAELGRIEFLDGEMLAGARDLGYIGRLQKDIPLSELALVKPFDYINADVLVYNLKGIRENYNIDFIMASWQKVKLRCSEQDALNKFFDEHKQIVNLCWNTYPKRMTSTVDIMCCPKRFVDEWENALKNPAIVHFAAVPKPWDYPLVGFGDQWWKVARKTVFYEEILLRLIKPKDIKASFINECKLFWNYM